MRDFLQQILYKAIQPEGELSLVPFAHHLYNLARNPKEIRIENLLLSPSDFRIPEINPTLEESLSGDNRFLSIHLAGFRKFPGNNDNKLYSLRFSGCDKENDKESHNHSPSSVVFLGNNGVGKTSLYNALEWAMVGNLPSRHKEIGERDFIRNAFGNSDPILVIETKQNTFTNLYDMDWNGIGHIAFLFSDADFNTLQSDDNISKYIYSQLNLSHIKSTLNVLEEILKIINVARPLYYVSELEETRFVENLKNSSINVLYVEALKKLFFEQPGYGFTSLEKDVVVTRDYLFKELHHTLKKNYTEIINPIFETLFADYQDSHKIAIILDGIDFKLKVEDTDLPPNEYLNTFRVMMFGFTLKVSLACAVRAIYDINLPIIVDDVFNSSDFDNRERLSYYISALLNRTEDLDIAEDLQLIVFTQDTLIAQSVYEGFLRHSPGRKILRSRIFDYQVMESSVEDGELEMVQRSFGGEIYNCIPLQHDY